MLSRFPLMLFLTLGLVCTSLPVILAQQPVSEQNPSSTSNSPQSTKSTVAPSAIDQPDAATMRLRLKNNGFGVGKMVPGVTPSVIGWQNDGFAQPFFFDVSAIRSISTLRAVESAKDKPQSHFVIESTDGQWLVGQIQGLDGELLTVQSGILGEVKLPIAKVSQLMRSDYSGEVVYPGLSQQAPWTPIGQMRDWEIRAGVLTAARQGAAILGELKLPAKCEILISLAWRGVPDFVVSLGVQAGERGAGQVASTARLEVWNRNIVLVRETEKDADLKRLAELNEKSPQVELSILMDQEKGLVVVQDVHGRLLGKLEVPEKSPRIGPAIHIVNHGPSLTVERLEVRRWNGSSMLGRNQNLQVVLGDNSTLQNSWLSRLDQAAGQFVVESRDGSMSNVPMDNVVVASFRPQADSVLDNSSAVALAEDNEIVEVIFADRSRLKGLWQAQQQGMLVVRSEWCQRDLVFPAEQVRGVTGTDARFAPDLTTHRNGIIKIGDSELAGFLVENVTQAGAAAIRWQPHGSQSSSEVIPTAQGSIAYRLQLPISASGQPTGRLDELLSQQRGEGSPQPATQSAKTTIQGEDRAADESAKPPQVTREIVFASGDTIDGYVERADEKGVYFLSDQTQVQFVEHIKMDRLWLNSMASTLKKSTDEKVRRLLTVPRAQRDDPPAHLLISVSGDFLRGRLVQLNDRIARFDLRSKIAEIPREKIAQIIWLHQRTWDPPTVSQTDSQREYSIHVVQQDRGLTFSPTHVAGGVIHGQSELLGPCQISIKQISQILFGPQLSERVAQFRENPWILSLAQLPRAFLENESDSETGNDSALIGKPAPPFSLSQLDGQQLKLSSLEGKVVVLDFWASWCGPCMKTLPLVNQVVDIFDPNEVRLVAINIQEAESRAQAAVERLAISAAVVLDRDGDVAASYLASAIPQTVVIDKTGLVRFVFVGGDSELGAKLKDAVNELLDDAG